MFSEILFVILLAGGMIGSGIYVGITSGYWHLLWVFLTFFGCFGFWEWHAVKTTGLSISQQMWEFDLSYPDQQRRKKYKVYSVVRDYLYSLFLFSVLHSLRPLNRGRLSDQYQIHGSTHLWLHWVCWEYHTERNHHKSPHNLPVMARPHHHWRRRLPHRYNRSLEVHFELNS